MSPVSQSVQTHLPCHCSCQRKSQIPAPFSNVIKVKLLSLCCCPSIVAVGCCCYQAVRLVLGSIFTNMAPFVLSVVEFCTCQWSPLHALFVLLLVKLCLVAE